MQKTILKKYFQSKEQGSFLEKLWKMLKVRENYLVSEPRYHIANFFIAIEIQKYTNIHE